MNTLEDLKSNANEVFEFKYCEEIYKRDPKALKTLNNLLDANFKLAFRRDYLVDKKTKENTDSIHLDSEDVFVVTKKGKVVNIQNSEWLEIYKV